MQKPSVLPDPVCPRPRMSRPARASGNVAVWMGNGAVMPAAASAATNGAGTPAPPKEAAAGARADDGRVGERLPAENGEQRPGALDEGRGAAASVGLRQRAQGGGELAARVRVVPGVGAGEDGSDGTLQFAAVGAGLALPLR